MTAIYQSPFLLALGWTIASSIWQTALLWMIYQAVANANGKMSPAVKHNLALTAILFSLGWFSITLSYKYNEFQQAFPVTAALTSIDTNATISATNVSGFMLTEFLNQYLPYISASYLLVLTLLAVRLVKAYFYAQKLKTTGLQEIDEFWSNKVEKYTGYLRIHKKVSIYLSSYIDVPATLNYFKPVILLPVAAFTQLSPQQVESVILHELAHIKRNDYLINIAVSVIETILFFNPFVHLLGKALKKEREHCCDDFVLHFRFDPHSYASALLSLEKLRIHTTPAGAIAATGNSRQLLGRVKRIMNVKSTGFNYGQKLLVLLITAGILISVAWLSPASRQNNSTEEKSARSTIIEEECVEETGEAVAKKGLDKRAVSRKPDAAWSRSENTIVKATTPSSTEKAPVQRSDEIVLAHAPPVPATVPTPPTPLSEFHAPPPPFPANSFEMLKDQDNFQLDGDVFKWQQQGRNTTQGEKNALLKSDIKLREKLDEKSELSVTDVFELLKIKGIDWAKHEFKMDQLELLLNNEWVENIELNFEDNSGFDIDLKMDKQQGKNRVQQNRMRERKNVDQLNLNEAERKQVFIRKKVQLDSLRQKSMRLAEQQKNTWIKKAESHKQLQNILQHTLFSMNTSDDNQKKSISMRRPAKERQRPVAVVISEAQNTLNAHSNATITYTTGIKTAASQNSISPVQQISRVVIDSGRESKTIFISIE